MCQIACIGDIQDNSYENKIRLEQVIKKMLIGMSESNRDGTGIAFSDTSGRVFMTKTAKAGNLVAETFSLDIDIDYKHFILHTRLATHGATNDENAHPHETKFGYMVHNGWCPSLFQKHKELMTTGCDSEALAHVYNPDPVEFEKGLMGSEHFAIIHLESNGARVVVMNKNKSLYRTHSKVLSADVFLTSSAVIADVGKLIGEDLNYLMVLDGDIFTLDGNTIVPGKFQFADSGWSYDSWAEYADTARYQNIYHRHQQKSVDLHNAGSEPIYHNRNSKKDSSIPSFVFKMTRKERARWIRDNKEKRAEYHQFWTHHERVLSLQEVQEKEFREEGFIILDADGNVIDD